MWKQKGYIRIAIEGSIPGEICSMKILKLETNRGIKNSYQYHSNVYKSCIDFPQEKGLGKKSSSHARFHFELKIASIRSYKNNQKTQS